MNVKFQVLGYRNFTSKAGNPLSVITVASDCTPRDNEIGRFGIRLVDFFLPDNKIGTLTPDCIGQEFVPSYEINGFGKPQLSDFELRPWKN